MEGKKMRRLGRFLSCLMGLFLLVGGCVGIVGELLGEFCYPFSKTIVRNPEYVQDVASVLSEDSREWLEDFIKEKSEEAKVIAILDCQPTSFEITDHYVNTVLHRVLKSGDEEPYMIITYFKDREVLEITTNLEEESVFNRTYELTDSEFEMEKEVSYLMLRFQYQGSDRKIEVIPACFISIGCGIGFLLLGAIGFRKKKKK